MSIIDNEIENAKAGEVAYMVLKMNSIQDKSMANKLYEASQAGVKIQLIARSINNVVSGIKGLSENIESISIVDRMLEHARVLIFANRGDEKIYLGSSDWMKRNLDQRVEVMTPILDEKIKNILRRVINIQLADNKKARYWDEDLTNKYKAEENESIRSQYEIYKFFKNQLVKEERKEPIAKLNAEVL